MASPASAAPLALSGAAPGHPVDRSEIIKVKRRFLNLNRLRLARVRKALAPHQRVVLDLLALLFHTNHPLMPGYVDKTCPSGVFDYTPTRQTLIDARKVARSFSMPKGVARRVEIHAIYLMGSSGTIAQSSESDFDIWLCHRPELGASGVDSLREKAAGIERWAATLGMEVHFFVMSADRFRSHGAEALSSESSGSAQHYLLLDEFYRTGLLISGRAPLWWLVPPGAEPRYDECVSTMAERRFINVDDYVDFGSVCGIGPGEFFGATLWQLTKAIEAPHKSLLKIVLLEAYASTYPRLDLLSTRYKAGVYAGHRNVDKLDPYIMLYDKVEEHLMAHGDTERLELARRCLYFKVGKSLRQIRKGGDWRCEVVDEMTRAWHWTDASLRVLDARPGWKVDRTLEERRAFVNALTYSYKLLSMFARENAVESTVSEHDMTVLGRKLFIAFEHKAGKIDIVNHGVSRDLTETHLLMQRVHAAARSDYWVLYRNCRSLSEARREKPLLRGRSAIELIAWCHFNRLFSATTRVIIEDESSGFTSRDVDAIIAHLRRYFLLERMSAGNVRALAASARLVRVGTFTNFGSEPLPEHARRGHMLTSARTDALSYSGWHLNLIQAIDYLVVTSWGEILAQKFTGMEGLLACLCEHMRWLERSGRAAPPPVSHCCAPHYGETITRRLSALFDGVAGWFGCGDRAPRRRYILRGGDCYHTLLDAGQTPAHEFTGSFSALLDHLEQPNSAFTDTVFDVHALDDRLLARVFAANEAKKVQFFYRLADRHALIYILDETGSLFTDRIAYHSEQALLGHFSLFFESVEFRRNSSLCGDVQGDGRSAADARPSSGMRLEFYQLHPTRDGAYRLRRIEHGTGASSGAFFNVKVTAEAFEGETEFTVYCNDREFSTREHGGALFERVTEHVLAKRRRAEPYPVYITDIDLSWIAPDEFGGGVLHTIQYLQYKKRIEHKLNRVLARRSILEDPSS